MIGMTAPFSQEFLSKNWPRGKWQLGPGTYGGACGCEKTSFRNVFFSFFPVRWLNIICMILFMVQRSGTLTSWGKGSLFTPHCLQGSSTVPGGFLAGILKHQQYDYICEAITSHSRKVSWFSWQLFGASEFWNISGRWCGKRDDFDSIKQKHVINWFLFCFFNFWSLLMTFTFGFKQLATRGMYCKTKCWLLTWYWPRKLKEKLCPLLMGNPLHGSWQRPFFVWPWTSRVNGMFQEFLEWEIHTIDKVLSFI